MALDEVEAQWGQHYPAIVDLWRRNWERFTPFLDLDPAIRRIIYTTNAVESLNDQLRKVTKTRGYFPTDAAVAKVLYLAMRNIGHTRGGERAAAPSDGNEHSTRSPSPSPEGSKPNEPATSHKQLDRPASSALQSTTAAVLVYSEIHDDEAAATAAGFWTRAAAWYRRHGITPRRVVTDNGACYRSRLWLQACEATGTRITRTRPYRAPGQPAR